MIDRHYKFPNATAMHAALAPLGLSTTDEDGQARLVPATHQYAAWEVGVCALPRIDLANPDYFERIPPQAQMRVRLKKAHPQFAPWEVGTDVAANATTAIHLNVRLLDAALDLAALEPYRLTPRTPDCVWA